MIPETIKDYVAYDESFPSCLRWVTQPGTKKLVGLMAGADRGDGYYKICFKKKRYYAHRVVWELHNGKLSKGEQIDHIDQNPSNNRISNLRIATNSENNCNRSRQSNNTSGFKGVSWNKFTQSWEAYIKLNGKRKFLGYFLRKESAALAYRLNAEMYHGQFAST